MSRFKQIEQAYIDWRNGRDFSTNQYNYRADFPANDETANNINYQPTSGRRRGRRGARSRGKNKKPQEIALAVQDQLQETTESSPMTPAEREAAAARFWGTALPATLFGFASNAEILAANFANETRNRSTSLPLVHTNDFQETHRPVGEHENLFDSDVSGPRATAILGGFVERRADMGKRRKDWVRERYIFAHESDEPVVEDEKKSTADQRTGHHDQEQTELTPNGMKKWEWYGKKLRKDAARDARKAARRQVAEYGGKTSPRHGNSAGNANEGLLPGDDNSGGTGYDHGGFQDTEEFFAEPTPQLNNFNPEAMTFEPGCKPSGGWGLSRRKDDPDDEMGGGLGVPEQVM